LIVERGRVTGLRRGETSATIPGYELAWRGVVYYPGERPGPAAIAAALSGAGPDPIVDVARLLRGNFLLAIRDVASGRTVAFTDSGGTFDAFVCGERVGSSFLELADAIGARRGDVDPAAVVEFLDFGKAFEGRTLLQGIQRLTPGHVYELRVGDPLIHDLEMPGIDAPPGPGFTLKGFFEELASSLAGLNVSVDLTGGSDTRLVAAMLSRALPFECAVSGTAKSSDVEIATDVARALGRPLHVTIHDASDVGEVAGDLFEAADGISDLLAGHRLRQFALARADRQIDVAVGGIGGEFLKDLFWLIDFPLYRWRTPHFERLLARWRPVPFPRALLSRRFASEAEEVQPRVLAAMNRRRMGTNTETYDRIYYDMWARIQAAHSISINDNYVPFVAPLLDPTVVRLGYSLPRRVRFFNRYHRRVITAASPTAARIPSSDTRVTRMTLSSRPWDELHDVPVYVLDKLRRLRTKVGQRLGRGGVYPTPDDPALIPAARSSDAYQRAVGDLVTAGVLSPAAQEQLPDRCVGAVMTLGMLFERLDS
jgi:asparagine synthetase B (glutamine-hydrolysing)